MKPSAVPPTTDALDRYNGHGLGDGSGRGAFGEAGGGAVGGGAVVDYAVAVCLGEVLAAVKKVGGAEDEVVKGKGAEMQKLDEICMIV